MHPSSLNINAAYQAALKSIEDHLFADEVTEQAERVPTHQQRLPLPELCPQRTRSSNCLEAITDREIATSSSLPVSISTIRQYLYEKKLPHNGLIDLTIQHRLNSASISADTLLAALQIAHTPAHPVLTALGASDYNREALIYRLVGIFNHKAGFRRAIRTAAQNCNNNPANLIAAILENICDPHH